MKLNKDLALLKQRHKEFCALIRGLEPDSFLTLSNAQQIELKYIAGDLYKGIRNLEGVLTDRLLEAGLPTFPADRTLICYYRENIVKDRDLIASIFEETDPDLFETLQWFDGPGRLKHGHVKRTFIAGLEKMGELCEEYPDLYDDMYMVDHAWEVVDSELIRFNPDKWIENSKSLQPIMTDKEQRLPAHVRLRLVELHRSFIFENWLSVISLSRATLEYAILDNCHKWNIKPKQRVTYPKEREQFKNLNTLIDEISEHDKELSNLMNLIREEGNDVAHPEKTDESREKLFARENVAKECVERLIHVVEFLYLPKETN